MPVKPALIVFDLDYTLWPFWVDTHVRPPFHKNKSGQVVDQDGQKIKYYPEVPEILEKLHTQGIKIGIASRTSEINGAYQLLALHNWKKYLSYTEIYPGSKVTHFQKIHADSKIPFSDMIFFDDERRNINDLTKLGVISILVTNGMTKEVLKEGLKQFESKKSKH